MSARIETLEGWVDLAAECLGGRALCANDEFFAAKENLLRPGRGIFVEDRYTDQGKWMDGWETRRRRTPGHDWCVVRLGLPGTVHAIVVDTHHFRGNHPEAASLHGLEGNGTLSARELAEHPRWRPLAARTSLQDHHENRLVVSDLGRLTHVRLNIFPDGGVARLRIFGAVSPDWARVLAAGRGVDLAALAQGGRPLDCSDAFFSRPINLLMAGEGLSMADGWETRRRRGPGHDWVVIRLGRRGVLSRAMVDTRHFKGNFPAQCSLDVVDLPDPSQPLLGAETVPADASWRPLLAPVALTADAEHGFDLSERRPATHVRLNIMPDGGVSRLRLFGRPVSGPSSGPGAS
jgi:allantoicase